MTNLKALTAFCLIQRRGSLSAAANDMNLSQPAVSRLIANLEHETGLRLFHRDRRALRPTDEARRFHREAERILAGLEQLQGIADDIRRGSGQRLRIVSMSRLSNSVLPRAVRSFRAKVPDVELIIETHHRRDVERWITGRQFDVGFGPLPINEPTLDATPMGSLPAVAVFGRPSPFDDWAMVSARDLAEHAMISLTPDTLMQAQTDAIFAAAGLEPRIGLRTSSSVVACLLAAEGLGYAVSDPATAGALGDRVISLPIVPLFELTFGTLTARGEPMTDVAQLFTHEMTEALADVRTHALRAYKA